MSVFRSRRATDSGSTGAARRRSGSLGVERLHAHIPSGHKTLVRYPDGTSKVITLYVRPVEGQVIAHGWEVTNVAAGAEVPIEYQISVVRPAKEEPSETAD